MAAGIKVDVLPPKTWTACMIELSRTCLPQISSKLGGEVGRPGALLLGKELLLTSLQGLSIGYYDSLTLPTTQCAQQSPLVLDLPLDLPLLERIDNVL